MRKSSSVKNITTIGILLALALTLSFVEMLITPLLALPPGVKIGLANLVSMFALISLGFSEALFITILKSVFVMLMKGPVAFAMSITGGLFSIVAMFIIMKILKEKNNFIPISIIGAVSHNIGQILMASIILGSKFVILYLNVLLISGVVVGVMTGVLFNALLPRLKKITFR